MTTESVVLKQESTLTARQVMRNAAHCLHPLPFIAGEFLREELHERFNPNVFPTNGGRLSSYDARSGSALRARIRRN